MVASGINRGPNLAMDVLYSGTVAAAMEGAMMGLPSFAVSLVTRSGRRSYSAAVVRKVDPRGRAYYWIGGDEQAHANVPGSDCDAVFDRGLISVTPLHLDLTLHALVEELKQWDLPGLAP